MSAANPTHEDLDDILSGPDIVKVPAAAPRRRTPYFETESGRRLAEGTVTLFRNAIPPVLGIAMFVALWALVAASGKSIPGPAETWAAAVELFSDPFYDNGPNDQGIGWNILHSLYRVGLGFGAAAAVGIPLGFMIGRFDFLSRMLSPIISILRPVSPLAWLPIGLLVLQKAEPASIWVIFISSIWPMVLNTAAGVQRIPQDYMNVARVLNLSELKVFTRILFPAVLPYVLTGVRLSIGVAWLVIVAAEMLTGGVGIVGLLLEQGLMLLAKRFSYE